MRVLQLAITILLFLTFSQFGFAQDESPLENFSIVQVDNIIEFRFGIRGGASCTGVDLERGTDSLNFEIVGLIPGICGGSNQTEYYTINDENPISGTISYYRLRLGVQGHSHAEPFSFIQLFDGVNVYPNPSQSQTSIRINNPGGNLWKLYVVDSEGKVRHEELDLRGNEVELSISGWPTGTYLLRIVRGENVIHRRLLVY